MYEFCYTIHGVRRCFPVAALIEDIDRIIHRPPPENMPELELAVTVLQLVKTLQPSIGNSEFSAKLEGLSRSFIKNVQEGLPKGVELHEAGTTGARAGQAA
jgi:hypothetical protein